MLVEEQFQKQKEFERLFAASAFISPGHVLEDCGWLQAEQLVDTQIRKFWQLLKEGKTHIEAGEEAGIYLDLVKWTGDVPSSMYAKQYANIITDRAYLAGVGVQIEKIAKAIRDNELDMVHTLIEEMAQHRPNKREKIPDANQIGVEFVQAVTKENRNLTTGIPGLDNNTGGLERQTLSVLGGRPSMGKSSLASQIARNVADPGGEKVLVFSLEMSRISWWKRIACGMAGVSWLDFSSGKLSPEEEAQVFKENDLLMQRYGDRLLIDDNAKTDTERIWRIVSVEKPGLVVVDHLRRVKDKNDNETKRQGWISERLNDIAKVHDCHVMAVAQLNRGVEGRADRRPLLSDLRDSGEIEENADLVFMLYRDDYYQNDSVFQRFSETELLIRKFRDGVRDARILMDYDTRRQWFKPKVTP
ncbi:MAG: replicative DNA helicase [Candidatus Thorarchaeota archaeon]|jgi:replicative DNA helicase